MTGLSAHPSAPKTFSSTARLCAGRTLFVVWAFLRLLLTTAMFVGIVGGCVVALVLLFAHMTTMLLFAHMTTMLLGV